MSLERRYQLVTGGRSFPKMSSALREVSRERQGTVPTAALLLPRATVASRDEPGAPQALLCSGSCAPRCLLAGAGCSSLLRASPWAAETITRLGGREMQQSQAWEQQHLPCRAAQMLQEPFSRRLGEGLRVPTREGIGTAAGHLGQALPGVLSLPDSKRGAVLVPVQGDSFQFMSGGF